MNINNCKGIFILGNGKLDNVDKKSWIKYKSYLFKGFRELRRWWKFVRFGFRKGKCYGEKILIFVVSFFVRVFINIERVRD